jgi:hypothetical protein
MWPDLDGQDGRETIAAALILTAGLWPIANPAPHVTAMFAEDPTLTRAHVDFEDRLQQLLSALITGFLNRQTPKPRRQLAGAAFRGQHAEQLGAFGLVDVRRLDDHQQAAGRPPELARAVILQCGELYQVAVSLGAEVDAVRVDDQLHRAARQSEVKQADARDVAGVGATLREALGAGGIAAQVAQLQVDVPGLDAHNHVAR